MWIVKLADDAGYLTGSLFGSASIWSQQEGAARFSSRIEARAYAARWQKSYDNYPGSSGFKAKVVKLVPKNHDKCSKCGRDFEKPVVVKATYQDRTDYWLNGELWGCSLTNHSSAKVFTRRSDAEAYATSWHQSMPVDRRPEWQLEVVEAP